MQPAIRPELYVKTAIVILGGFLGVTAAEQLGLATSVMFRGLCAIVEAYLIYWAVVYYVARRYFGFSREWAAPLASGISICGVSAAIATGSAIRARPIVPVMVSSLVVIFAVVELILLPFVAQHFLSSEPMVAGAWMGLAVKTDGAAVTSGAITDALIVSKAFADQGIRYQPGWIMGAATTVKVFIDVFIGVWAFILAWIWAAKIETRSGDKVKLGEIWDTIPEVHSGIRCHISDRSRDLWTCACVASARQGGNGRGERIPRHLLCADIFHDRRCVRFPPALGGRNRQARRDLCRLSLRLHHMGRSGDILAFFPRSEAAAAGLMYGKTENW